MSEVQPSRVFAGYTRVFLSTGPRQPEAFAPYQTSGCTLLSAHDFGEDEPPGYLFKKNLRTLQTGWRRYTLFSLPDRWTTGPLWLTYFCGNKGVGPAELAGKARVHAVACYPLQAHVSDRPRGLRFDSYPDATL
ncbi:hypothetical protein SAMN05192563_10513 [Paraburkholderia aspalathi]|uniref:Uncharacterized protein n=1 Tax=Paraburkholderia aspalathi TaxID=1324617 RepID=A0A1I7EQQ9_9BURK|nr:hypothetical protein SAMN05192563_10513 [Paraburkholderia aspalathi]